jgi:hypothetical protein
MFTFKSLHFYRKKGPLEQTGSISLYLTATTSRFWIQFAHLSTGNTFTPLR